MSRLERSVLGPLLFLIYINDLNVAINYAIVHHFADDTNLLITGKSLKTITKHTNIDLKLLCNWLKANKISLNSSKTEAILFRHPNKNIDYDLKLKIDGKRIFLTNSVKYLGIHFRPTLKLEISHSRTQYEIISSNWYAFKDKTLCIIQHPN